MTKTETKRNGIGFWGLLTIVFIVLKLTNIITWSWVWVLAPIWIGAIVVGITLVGVLIYAMVKAKK